MFSSAVSSWNLRDKHMMQTLVEIDRYISNKNSKPAKVIVWAHNSHLGDARATEMAVRGELNLGQLVRQHYADEVFLLGFSTYHGTVTASSDWGDPAEAKSVLPALKGSYEALMHQSALSKFILPLKKDVELIEPLSEERLQRAIGVIYRPETERQSHYLYANLPRQFDALIHIDKTSAVRPLDISQYWQSGEAPETFPVGI
jgi:erythromycin esterase-like protein